MPRLVPVMNQTFLGLGNDCWVAGIASARYNPESIVWIRMLPASGCD